MLINECRGRKGGERSLSLRYSPLGVPESVTLPEGTVQGTGSGGYQNKPN